MKTESNGKRESSGSDLLDSDPRIVPQPCHASEVLQQFFLIRFVNLSLLLEVSN